MADDEFDLEVVKYPHQEAIGTSSAGEAVFLTQDTTNKPGRVEVKLGGSVVLASTATEVQLANSDVFGPGTTTYKVIGKTAGRVDLLLELRAGTEVVARDRVELIVITPAIEAVTFSQDAANTLYTVKQDGGSPYPATDHWLDANSDGDAKDTGGDHRFPLALTVNAKLKALPTVDFREALPSTSEAPWPWQFAVKGTFGTGSEYPSTAAPFVGSGTQEIRPAAAITSNSNLATALMRLEHDVKWYVTLNEGTTSERWFQVGVSDNRVYTIASAPRESLMFETVMDVAGRACSGSSGSGTSATHSAAMASIWAEFTATLSDGLDRKEKDGFNLSDGVRMRYWDPAQVTENYRVSQLVTGTDSGSTTERSGQCGAWAEMLGACMSVLGYRSEVDKIIVRVDKPGNTSSASGLRFMVKDWTLSSSGSAPSGSTPSGFSGWDWVFSYHKVGGGQEGTAHPEVSVGTRVMAQGNSDSPAYFWNHLILKYDGHYYDPSYGVKRSITASATTNHESQACDGALRLIGIPLEPPVTLNGDLADAYMCAIKRGSSNLLDYSPIAWEE